VVLAVSSIASPCSGCRKRFRAAVRPAAAPPARWAGLAVRL